RGEGGGWREIDVVKVDGGGHHPRRCRSVSFQPVVMRGGQHKTVFCTKFVEQSDGQRGAFFGRRSGSHFVDQNERLRRGGFQHAFQIQHVRGKSGKVRGNRLFVADIHEHAIEN